MSLVTKNHAQPAFANSLTGQNAQSRAAEVKNPDEKTCVFDKVITAKTWDFVVSLTKIKSQDTTVNLLHPATNKNVKRIVVSVSGVSGGAVAQMNVELDLKIEGESAKLKKTRFSVSESVAMLEDSKKNDLVTVIERSVKNITKSFFKCCSYHFTLLTAK